MTYMGGCHCGDVAFRFESESIETGVRCNCSICTRKGAVMSTHYFPPDRFTLLQGRDALSVYRFGDRTVNHWFCGRCGIYTFHDTTERPGRYRVNLGCVEGIDPLALRISLIDGRSF